MYSRTVLIQNRTGLHARPASEFVTCASKFKSKITIKNVSEEDKADAKSIMLLLTLGLTQGTEVEISANGEDETEAVDTLVQLIESKFGEE
ncbi:MAG: HPr family phosphocarrier protein [Defluviitaleaceae bacterium]|nr:HPr family phosphocarrier protein [Defluviitaleaceae bacterium]